MKFYYIYPLQDRYPDNFGPPSVSELHQLQHAMISQMGLIGKGSKNIQISDFSDFSPFFINMGMNYAKLGSFRNSRSSICSCHTQEQAIQQHDSMAKTGGMSHFQGNDIWASLEIWQEAFFFQKNKRLSQIESTQTGNITLFLLL